MNILLEMPEYIMPGIQDMVRLFYPGARFNKGEPELSLKIDSVAGKWDSRIAVAGLATFQNKLFAALKTTTLPPGDDRDKQVKRLSRLVIFLLLQMNTGGTPTPWGIFTGIRPTKVAHRLWDEGLRPEEIVSRLREDFAVREDKAFLLSAVAAVQRPYLPKAGRRPGTEAGNAAKTGYQAIFREIDGTGKVSLYIGIPFCPTRCLYCSFPSYPLGKFGKWVEPFAGALTREIRAVGAALEKAGVTVQSIYMGGGTPTCLPPAMLDSLLGEINRHLRSPATIEFTVEGGRPDTLTGEVLEICAGRGADRISINPQTMEQKTLRAIGRSHSVDDVYKAVEKARKTGFKTINMDIILGLPGETAGDAAKTMAALKELRPENISVHTLAVKRASRLSQELANYPLAAEATAGEMLEASRRAAEDMGMIPYYLYRQKRMLGNLENVGYSLPGHLCVYNIQIMEERQTVLGLGAGAGTKWVRPGDWFLTGGHHPKEPWLYVERIDELIAGKIKGLQNFKIT